MFSLPEDWRERVGDPAQIARLDRFTESDGPGAGSRRFRVETGGGLAFDLLPDRALDIGPASFGGVPLAWISPAGFSPARARASRGSDWLRAFGGGLLATCGLDSFGPPSTDGGRVHGQHGPVGVLPAEITRAEVDPDAGRIVVAGRIRQTALFAETLVLERRIEAALGGAEIVIEDRVTNAGVAPEGHMILYHCNLGWPLLDAGARVTGPAGAPQPRDAAAEAGLADWAGIGAPEAEYPEQVFVHAAPEGPAEARLDNAALGLSVAVRWDGAALPAMLQWKLLRRRHYVLGLEPANTAAVEGRAAARAAGALPILAPGESRRYRLSLAVGGQR